MNPGPKAKFQQVFGKNRIINFKCIRRCSSKKGNSTPSMSKIEDMRKKRFKP